MQFNNSSAFQIKKVQLFDRFCQSLHFFIVNLSCFFKSFCFRSCAFITHYIYYYYDASNPDGPGAFTAAAFRLQGKCDTTLRGSARCHPPCRCPESASGWCSLQLSECLPDGAGSMRLRSHSVMHHIFLKAHPIPGSAPEIFHFR